MKTIICKRKATCETTISGSSRRFVLNTNSTNAEVARSTCTITSTKTEHERICQQQGGVGAGARIVVLSEYLPASRHHSIQSQAGFPSKSWSLDKCASLIKQQQKPPLCRKIFFRFCSIGLRQNGKKSQQVNRSKRNTDAKKREHPTRIMTPRGDFV